MYSKAEALRILDAGTPEEMSALQLHIEREGLHLVGRPDAAFWAEIEDKLLVKLYPDA